MKRFLIILILAACSIESYSQKHLINTEKFLENQRILKIKERSRIFNLEPYYDFRTRLSKRKIVVDFQYDDSLTQVLIYVTGYFKNYDYSDYVSLYSDNWDLGDDERIVDSVYQDLYNWINETEIITTKQFNAGTWYNAEVIHLTHNSIFTHKSYVRIRDLNLDVPTCYAMDLPEIIDFKKKLITYFNRHNIKIEL
jgi:hypothetical protein